MKTVLFLIDACRYDYISKDVTPFLWECSNTGMYYKHVVPSAGFCERTEIFTGKKPNESGFFTAIGFDPQKSTYRHKKGIKIFGFIEDILLKKWNEKDKLKIAYYYRIIIKKFFKNYLQEEKLKTYNIPFSFLKYFNLTEDEFEFNDISKQESNSILKIVEKKLEKTFFNSFTSLGDASNSSDLDRLNNVVCAFKKNSYLFTPIYLGKIDAFGHVYGPNSNVLNLELRKLDQNLKTCVSQLKKIDNSTNFIFLGDHGMTKVEKHIDIQLIINSLADKIKLKKGKDYIYFLDSTLLRIWFLSDSAGKQFLPLLEDNYVLKREGKTLTKEISKKYSIPFNDKRYGDFTWWANEGVLIFPDFFHNKEPYKGMHGYSPEITSTHGTCIVVGDNIETSYSDKINLYEVYDIINNLLKK